MLDPKTMAYGSYDAIAEAISECGFQRRKALLLVKISHRLLKYFGGHVPRDKESLYSLTGVGLKVLFLMMNECFGQYEGEINTDYLI